MQYQKSQRAVFGANGARNAGSFGQNNGGQKGLGNVRFGNGGDAVVGEVTGVDETSITVKLRDGSSKIVILSKTTSINKRATGNKDDIKTGENIAVFGAQNSDGSITAQNVQLNPSIREQVITPTAK